MCTSVFHFETSTILWMCVHVGVCTVGWVMSVSVCVCLTGVDGQKKKRYISPPPLHLLKHPCELCHTDTNTPYQYTHTHTRARAASQLRAAPVRTNSEGVFTPFTQYTNVDVHRQTRRTQEKFSRKLFPQMERAQAVK